MELTGAVLSACLRWLVSGALDGALFAALAWLAAASLLRRSSARLHSLLWRGVLLQFVLLRPFQLHALPQLELQSALPADVQSAGSAAGWGAAVLGYGLIVLWLLGRRLLAARRLRRRIAGYAPADAWLVARLQRASAALSLGAPPELRVAEAALAPFTHGAWRPVLVLPRWLCTPGERLDAVLLHELAHIQRGDHWWLCIERGIVSLFFFWPPVYWVSRELDLARELACDERALQRGGFSAAGYGRHLVDVVRAARQHSSAGGALAIGHGGSRLELRIDRLLGQTGARRSRALEALVLTLLAAGSLLALRPVVPALAQLTPLAPPPAFSGVEQSSDANMCVATPEELPACALRAAQLGGL